MAQQNLNLGTTPNDGTGDTLRCAFCKTETNFTDVYSCISGIDNRINQLDESTDQLELFSWGFGNAGRLGTNNTTSYSTPTQEHCGGTNWCVVNAGGYHTSAIKTDGTLWSWGFNCVGQLGTNNTTLYSTPTQEFFQEKNWCAISGGQFYTTAIKSNGTLWSWGFNCLGSLGTNNNTCYSVPTQEHCGGTNWCVVSAGCGHTSAIKSNGTLWSWGFNFCGRLGTNNTTSYSTPTQEHCGGTNWCTVSAGFEHTSAIKTDGTLWSWGDNYFNQLGTNNNTSYSKPTQEACGGTNWCMVSSGHYYTFGIKTDGTLWGWGDNYAGQLGTNNTTQHSTPQQEACGGTNWCTVSGGQCHNSAIKTNGTLWTWGNNNFGQLGTNSITLQSIPTQEYCGGNTWCMISSGSAHTSAIRID